MDCRDPEAMGGKSSGGLNAYRKSTERGVSVGCIRLITFFVSIVLDDGYRASPQRQRLKPLRLYRKHKKGNGAPLPGTLPV
jgi:hypothetical protein